MMKEIYFAAGCFWGTQKLFSSIRGVKETSCGFCNGRTELGLSYERVCQGDTGSREAVFVRYDPEAVSLEALLKAYYLIVDPTQKDQQGPDVGSQYQCGIYCTNDPDLEAVKAYSLEEAKKYPRFTVELLPLESFIPAEEYHQDYLTKNPGGYCHVDPTLFSRINDLIF